MLVQFLSHTIYKYKVIFTSALINGTVVPRDNEYQGINIFYLLKWLPIKEIKRIDRKGSRFYIQLRRISITIGVSLNMAFKNEQLALNSVLATS